MPVDVRKVIFDSDEVLQALENYCAGKAQVGEMRVPDQPLEAYAVVDDDGEELTVILSYAAGTAKVKLSAEQALEALIFVCRQDRIPLPRKGHKYLQRHKDGLAITIGLSAQDLSRV